MKKIILSVLFVSTILSVSAQSPSVCIDLSANLVRGAESKNVLALQSFLYVKGILKATPNGYFGGATLAAVKAYQKSKGLSQVGNTGPATRAAIKKDSCSASALPQTIMQTASTTMNQPIVTPVVKQQVFPYPAISSFDTVTLFAEGETEWNLNMYGSNFSSSTNTVRFRNLSNRRTYTIGTFASASGTVIILPKNITGMRYSCGTDCQEKLHAGQYEVTVTTAGGESAPRILTVQAFTINAETGALQGALPANATSGRFGTLSFSSSQPVIVRSVTLQTSSSTISSSGLGTVVLKDEIAGSSLLSNQVLSSFQSMIIGAYVNTNNKISGTINGAFTVEVEDYIGKKRTKFTSPSFLVTVAGVL